MAANAEHMFEAPAGSTARCIGCGDWRSGVTTYNGLVDETYLAGGSISLAVVAVCQRCMETRRPIYRHIEREQYAQIVPFGEQGSAVRAGRRGKGREFFAADFRGHGREDMNDTSLHCHQWLDSHGYRLIAMSEDATDR